MKPKNKNQAERLAVLAILALALSTSVPGIEVELANGKKLDAKRLTFNGKSFTIYAPSAATTFFVEQIQYFDTEKSQTPDLEAENTRLEKENLEFDKRIKTLVVTLKENNEKAEESVQDYTNLLGRLRKTEEELAATNADELKKTIEKLEAQAKEDKSNINKLTVNVERLGSQTPRPTATPAATPTAPKPPVVNVTDKSYRPARNEGLVDVMGRIQNSDSRPFEILILQVSALDKDGKLLDAVFTYISNFEPGSTRSFTTDLEARFDFIESIEVTPAEFF